MDWHRRKAIEGTARRWTTVLPYGGFWRKYLCWHYDFELLTSRTVRKIDFCF
jgi:hypothetical protein